MRTVYAKRAQYHVSLSDDGTVTVSTKHVRFTITASPDGSIQVRPFAEFAAVRGENIGNHVEVSYSKNGS